MPYFTKENAKEYSRQAIYARWHAPKPPQKPEPETLVNGNGSAIEEANQFGVTLAQACTETLEMLRKSKEPQHRAQLARCLRDLRETWHLATGKPRPGQTRPDSIKTPPRRMPSAYAPAPPNQYIQPQQPMPSVAPTVPSTPSNGGETGQAGPQGDPTV